MTDGQLARSASRRLTRAAAIGAGVVLLGVVLLSGCASSGSAPGSAASGGPATAPSASPVAAAPAAGVPADCQPYERTELFFGTSRKAGPPVSDQEFSAFMDAEVTPRFPDGLTLMSGLGQYRGSDGRLTKERSMQLILLYPKPSVGDSGTKIEEIRHLYEQKFNQESVLRADDPEPRCVAF